MQGPCFYISLIICFVNLTRLTSAKFAASITSLWSNSFAPSPAALFVTKEIHNVVIPEFLSKIDYVTFDIPNISAPITFSALISAGVSNIGPLKKQ